MCTDKYKIKTTVVVRKKKFNPPDHKILIIISKALLNNISKMLFAKKTYRSCNADWYE
jgi:hypothetical protein